MKQFICAIFLVMATAFQASAEDYFNFYSTKEMDWQNGSGYSALTELKFEVGIFDNQTESAVFFASARAKRIVKGEAIPGRTAEKVIFHLKTQDLISFSVIEIANKRTYKLVFEDPSTKQPVTLYLSRDGNNGIARMSLADHASERQWEVTVAERYEYDKMYADMQFTGPWAVLEPGNRTFVDPKLYFQNRNRPQKTSTNSPASYSKSDPKDSDTNSSYKFIGTQADFDKLLAEFNTLLNQPRRPTVAQLRTFVTKFEKHTTQLPKTIPFLPTWHTPHFAGESLYNQFLTIRDLLETNFPNSTFYFLGRDAYLAGDGLDAAFQAVGKNDRVKRLPASAPSFYGVTDEAIVGFLETHGIRVEAIDDNTPPIIILDVTSYSKIAQSQSRQIMQAAFRKWVSLGRDPRKLANKLFFFNISRFQPRAAGVFGEANFSIANYVKNVELVPEPGKLPTLAFPAETIYTSAWYNIYGRIEAQADGTYDTKPGYGSSEYEKKNILSQLWSLAVESKKETNTNCKRALGGGF